MLVAIHSLVSGQRPISPSKVGQASSLTPTAVPSPSQRSTNHDPLPGLSLPRL
ncbi:hypothetical protein KPB2_5340 [Klebsiella pneumoniae Kb677]|nr:hypothetical protein KPB2_5340 [Klebsiella pneumoniae Kb677]